MCTILLAYKMFHEQPLVVLPNRDEYYERPTQLAGYWEDDPNIYGGRDLVGGGTWLGVTATGRFAAVTNFRDPTAKAGSRTRGGLVTDFLRSEMRCSEFLKTIASSAREYSPFNLLFGEFGSSSQELWYFSNRCDEPMRLSPGIYGLSNHLLDAPLPRVESEKQRLTKCSDPNHFAANPHQLLANEGWVRFIAKRWGDWAAADLKNKRAIEAGEVRSTRYTVRYETLYEETEAERGPIYRFLGLDPSMADPLSGESKTTAGFGREDPLSFYRKGEVGDWRTYFAPNEHATRWFKESAGQALIDLEYEKDDAW